MKLYRFSIKMDLMRITIVILVSIAILLNILAFYHPIWICIGYDEEGNIVSIRRLYLFSGSYIIESNYYIVLSRGEMLFPYSSLVYIVDILILISTNIYLVYTVLLIFGGVSSIYTLKTPFTIASILSIIGIAEVLILLHISPELSMVFKIYTLDTYLTYTGRGYYQYFGGGFYLLFTSLILQLILLIIIWISSKKRSV